MQLMKTIGGVVVGAVLGVAATLAAQTAPQGTRREPQFDNPYVKAWKSIIMPNQPLSMHRHEHPRALIALTGGTVDITQKSGESERVVWETGKAYWLTADKPGTTHADINVGTAPIEVIVVELQQH